MQAWQIKKIQWNIHVVLINALNMATKRAGGDHHSTVATMYSAQYGTLLELS